MFNFLKKTKEKAENAIDETKEKVGKLADSADKFISDGNNQMKAITIAVIGIGISMILSNIVTIFTNVHTARHVKEPKVINNLYFDKGRVQK
jgi:uncharacterized RmlC-like cupin family protein